MTDEKGLATRQDAAGVLEQVVIKGDLSSLSTQDKVIYYRAVCDSVGINPLTRPFDYLHLNGKLVLYANKGATDQIRGIRGISASVVSRERIEDVYVVTVRVTDASGRTDEAIGAVAISGLKGDALANALMKSETKAKRRATLSLVGLGMLDETEVETIKDARRIPAEAAEAMPPSPRVVPAPVEVDAEWEGPDEDAIVASRAQAKKLARERVEKLIQEQGRTPLATVKTYYATAKLGAMPDVVDPLALLNADQLTDLGDRLEKPKS